MRLSKNNFTKPLNISLEFSNSIRWGIAILHLLITSVIMLVSNSLIVTILLLLIVLSSYLYYYQWHVAQSLVKSIVRVKLSAAGEWLLLNSKNKLIKATLQPTSFLGKYLLILNCHSLERKKYTVLIPKGRIHSNDFRQLKVRLRTKANRKSR